jgi:hypothetical protein
MSRTHNSSRDPSPWLPSSQIFAGTSRVDLFNDAKWEMTPSRPLGAGAAPPSLWEAAKAVVTRRLAPKRGRHSPRPN